MWLKSAARYRFSRHPPIPALMRRPADVPACEPDLYSTQSIVDPHPHYARLRRLGPVVWLTKQRVYALSRYAQCKALLRDDTTFISGQGVGLNGIFNRLSRGTTLNSDGDEHDQRRKLVAHRPLPRALRTMSDVVTRQAEQLVAEAVRHQHRCRRCRDQRLASTVGPLRREFRLHREGNAQSLTCHWSVSDILPVDDIACGAERCVTVGRRRDLGPGKALTGTISGCSGTRCTPEGRHTPAWQES